MGVLLTLFFSPCLQSGKIVTTDISSASFLSACSGNLWLNKKSQQFSRYEQLNTRGNLFVWRRQRQLEGAMRKGSTEEEGKCTDWKSSTNFCDFTFSCRELKMKMSCARSELAHWLLNFFFIFAFCRFHCFYDCFQPLNCLVNDLISGKIFL